MPVNEEIPEPEPTLGDRFAMRSRVAITGGGSMAVRTIVLFVTAIICVALAPVPANMVGVAAVVLLALDTAARRR
jgi:predicted glycosyltransferase